VSEAAAVRKLERRSSGEMVADHLRREIFAGRFAPGDRIPQEEVAVRLGVSRIPVREALMILENEGRVRMEHQRGAFVLGMDAGSVRDNAEIYGRVYGFIARRAAEQRTPELCDRLGTIAEGLATASPAETWRLAEAYLDAALAATAAPRMAWVLRQTRTLAVDNLFDVVPETMEITRTGTITLIEAILAGDADRAEAVQTDMQRRGADLVVQAFASRGAAGPEAGTER
jgi:DNA-binding GntR family transcriptional regulator